MLEYTEEQGTRWFGADVEHDTARTCLEALDRALLDTFGVPLYRTPGLTGLMAWQRRWGHAYKPLPLELQNLIRSTTTQGRFECCPILDPIEYHQTIPALVCLDMRWAYAAAAQAIVGGKEWRHEEKGPHGWPLRTGMSSDLPGGFCGYTPARYRVQFQAPEDWSHVGILPARWPEGWIYPVLREYSTDTWADHTEIRLAIECGWQVEILERLICVDEVRYHDLPLLRWCEAMLRLRDQLCQPEEGTPPEGRGEYLYRSARDGRRNALYSTAIRAMILQAIGLMVAGPHTVTARAGSRDELPGHDLAEESYYEDLETGEIVYQDYAPSGITRLLHPEIAAAVWGQTRTWLLRKRQKMSFPAGVGPIGNTGALSLPREQIVGFGLDCLYLTADPGWPDDGREGRWQMKWHREGPLPAPKHRGELEALGQ